MWEHICEPAHLLLVTITLMLALLLLGGGKGIGTLVRPFICKLTGWGKGPPEPDERGYSLPNGVEERRIYPPITITDIKNLLEVANTKARCSEHSTIKERQDGGLKDTSFMIQDCKEIWLEIKAINLRQLQLREKLPEQYVNKSELGVMNDRLKSIDNKLDRYFERMGK